MTVVISGSKHGERWMDFEQKAGTDIASFYDFFTRILNNIGPGTQGGNSPPPHTTKETETISGWD